MQIELKEQIAVITWWKSYAGYSGGTYPVEALFHIPNEGQRGAIGGYIQKAQGLRPGVPDLCLAVPSGRYHGLYIEMKSEKGRPTQKQKDFIEMLKGQGYAAVVCYGARQAIDTIESYLREDYEDDDDE